VTDRTLWRACRWALCALAFGTAGAAPALSAEEAATTASEPTPGPDFSGYQKLLDEFLSVTSTSGAPLETRFDYTRLYMSPDAGERFVLIRKQLFDASPARLDPRARLAWAINGYNFLVIQAVTEHLFESMQRSQHAGKRIFYALRARSVQNILVDDQPFFDARVVEIDSVGYSLNAFERHFVFADYVLSSGSPRPAGLDPRAHFALVCASIGCPSLMPRPYRADSLDAQLDFAVRNALASPTHLRWNKITDQLEGSYLFEWYLADFGGRDSVLGFAKKYAPRALVKEIERRKLPWIPAFIPWDWQLNNTPPRDDEPGAGDRRSR
jgi:hypothetical protein